MMMLRWIAIMYPKSQKIKTISNPIFGVLVILGVMMICCLWDSSRWLQYSIRNLKERKDCFGQMIENNRYEYHSSSKHRKTLQSLAQMDGVSHVITCLIYLFTLSGLVVQLHKIKNSRRNFHKKEVDKNSIILIFATSFFIYELFGGSVFLMNKLAPSLSLNSHFIFNQTKCFSSKIFVICSLVQCVIPYILSAEFRQTAVRTFLRRSKKMHIVSISPSVNKAWSRASSSERFRIMQLQ
ncbi:hypothetical protein GCK72_019910 [Caenorhabditis remanei]|uniref:G-protein coupled receptors family 1 profile domain-containing protein n=1 Tax=Caenorhabditis remanei TaxID=31234 RepID=A0A6A5GF32_CAERE|nr:hypothetical protein GCK72_019910 [Caenorhabditis remanei]KAF1753354.1 hypothetical protein GCK72_019910 [Caenorhabditis remanei]